MKVHRSTFPCSDIGSYSGGGSWLVIVFFFLVIVSCTISYSAKHLLILKTIYKIHLILYSHQMLSRLQILFYLGASFFLQIAAVMTLPFDVVKTRRQIELGEMETQKGKWAKGLFSLDFDYLSCLHCQHFFKADFPCYIPLVWHRMPPQIGYHVHWMSGCGESQHLVSPSPPLRWCLTSAA